MLMCYSSFFFHAAPTTEIYTLSLHDALPICVGPPSRMSATSLRSVSWTSRAVIGAGCPERLALVATIGAPKAARSEEHTSELQSRLHLVCRLLLEKKKDKTHLKCTSDRHNVR